MSRKFLPPATQFGGSKTVQNWPAAAPGRSAHVPPPTRFGPGGSAQPMKADSARGMAPPPRTDISSGPQSHRAHSAPPGISAGKCVHRPPPSHFGPPATSQAKLLGPTSSWTPSVHSAQGIPTTPSVLQRSTTSVVADPATIFATFVGEKRTGGLVYSAVGVTNCEALSLGLLGRFTEAGISGAQTKSLIGQGRYVISAPSFIDQSWAGGRVTNNGHRVAHFVHFENHTAVLHAGTVYDPTCGYVGPENGWYCAYENIDEINGREIPYDEDEEENLSIWKAKGPVMMVKRYGQLKDSEGSFALVTAEQVVAELDFEQSMEDLITKMANLRIS